MAKGKRTSNNTLGTCEDIEPGGRSSRYLISLFADGKSALEKKNYHIISMQENAELRIQEGRKSIISESGNCLREAFVYLPNKEGTFLTKKSPIMENPAEAANCNRENKDYYLNSRQVKAALSDSNSIKLEKKIIQTNEFSKNKIMRFAFGEIASLYGNFLEDNGIKEICIPTIESDDNEPFARQVFFYGLDEKNEERYIFDGIKKLHFCLRVRGIKGKKEIITKFPDFYTYNDIQETLKKLRREGLTQDLEERILNELKNNFN